MRRKYFRASVEDNVRLSKRQFRNKIIVREETEDEEIGEIFKYAVQDRPRDWNGDIFITSYPTEDKAIAEAGYIYNHLTRKEKFGNVIEVLKGKFDENINDLTYGDYIV